MPPQGLRTFEAVLFSSLPELRRAHARVGLEVLAESELLGKTELVGHLLDLDAGLAEQTLGLVDGDHIDPFHRGVARLLFYDV